LSFVDWRGKRSKGIPHPSLSLPEQRWRPRGAALPVEAGSRGEEEDGSALLFLAREERIARRK
jgi:hypothetical protein